MSQAVGLERFDLWHLRIFQVGFGQGRKRSRVPVLVGIFRQMSARGRPIPASRLCRANREWNNQAHVNRAFASGPFALAPGAVWLRLHILEESQQLVISPIATGIYIVRCGFGQNFLLECEIGIEVDLCGFDGFMP